MNINKNKKDSIVSKLDEYLLNNDLKKIKEISEKYIKDNPEEFIGYYFLAKYFYLEKNTIKAEEYYIKALKLNNKNPSLLSDIGKFYYSINNLEKAFNYYNDSLSLDKNSFEVLNNIGLVYLQLNQPENALDFFNKSLIINPNYITALNNRAISFNMLNKFNNAIKDCKKIILMDPEYPSAFNNLGWAYLLKGKIEEAILEYKKAIKLKPNYIDALNNLGGAYFNLGKKQKACECYMKALDIDKTSIESFRSLVINKGISSDHEKSIFFYELYKKNEKEINDYNHKPIPLSINKNHSSLCFALGYLCDIEGKYNEAFKYFERANNLFRLTYEYEIEFEERLFSQLKEAFNKNLYKNISEESHPTSAPIFIIGMPRSGTTLVEQILSSHSQVIGLGEIEFIKKLTSSAMNKVSSNNLKDIQNLSSEDRVELGNEYLDDVSDFIDKNKVKTQFTDKQMLNFIYLGFIKMILPKAKVIHIKRNSMDNCFSIYSLRFNGHQPFAYNQVELAKYYKMYENMMDHWREIFPEYIYDIEYESLVSNLDDEVKRILDFCDLKFEEDCVNFYQNKRSIVTSSSLQVREKVYSSSINRWKNYEKELKPLYDELNKKT